MNTSHFTSTGGRLPNRYHFIGIGGIGMSALAQIACQKGARVSGSDVAASYITEHLQKMGIEIFFEHAEQNIKEPTVIVYNTMIDEENPEMRAAKELQYPLIHRSDLLHDLMRHDAALVVTGTHGKTTTSSLLAHVLVEAKMNPSFAVGGFIKSLGTNGRYGMGPYFVAEGDESDGSFLKYHPFGAILTNIDGDHFDYWRTKEALAEGFDQFAHKVSSPEHLFWCGDDDALRSLPLKGLSYGFESGNALKVLNFRQKDWKTFFDLAFEKKEYPNIEIPLIGAHNVLNAAAVFGMALRLNIPPQKIRDALSTFQGIGRRADYKGEVRSIAVYDDYAHHPTEIFATLRAMKHAIDHRRLVVAFQPHRYTRTRDCFAEFGPAFSPADLVVLTDVYAAGERPIEGINALNLMKKIEQSCPAAVRYCARKDLSRYLCSILVKNDVLVTMGAGDITKCGPEVLSRLNDE